jgi:predicted component of type VI protein secretion system
MPAGALVGRGLECQLQLPHASVSRVHARIEQRGAAFWLVDQGSRNGLRVGTERKQDCELTHGLRILCGEFPLRVDLLGAAPAANSAEEDLEFVDALEGLELLQTRVAPRSPGLPSGPTSSAADSGAAWPAPEPSVTRLPRASSAQRDTPPAEAPGLTLEDPAQIQLERPKDAPAPGPAAQARERQAAFLREEQRNRTGLWRGDFEQLSFGQQAMLFGLALLVLLGIAALIATLIAGAK